MTEVSRFIQRNTRLSAEISEAQRKDIIEYPSVPLREVITNALVHADYSIKGMNPRITIFSNKLEVESPGSFPFGFTLEDFFAGVSHVRNKVIARIFRELGLMEEWGTGYRRIKEVCKQLGYETPTWSELGSSVRVAFSPHRVAQLDEDEPECFQGIRLSPRQEKILALFEQKNTLTAREVKEKLEIPISDRMLRVDLLFLKKRGVLTTTGKGPSTCWKRVKNKR